MKIQCDCGEWFEDSFIAEWGGVCSTCKAEADLKAQKDAVADVRCNEGSSANADMGTKTKNYDYEDMLAAFTAGRRHHKECADSLDDCWDFAIWIKEGYGT
jgi:hypothetical protein